MTVLLATSGCTRPLLVADAGPTDAASSDASLSDAAVGFDATAQLDAGSIDAGPPRPNDWVSDIRFDDPATAEMNPADLPARPGACRAPVLVRVESATDGDTVQVSGVRVPFDERVRFIGVDTPERGRDGRPDECFAAESSAFTAALTGHLAWLTFDRECFDRYDRALAYLYIGGREEDFWQRQLLRRGYAVDLRIEPNTAFSSTFSEDVAVARGGAVGRWLVCP